MRQNLPLIQEIKELVKFLNALNPLHWEVMPIEDFQSDILYVGQTNSIRTNKGATGSKPHQKQNSEIFFGLT